MRLIKFHVDQHLLLRDLELPFDRDGRLDVGDYALDFLVGVNGSGKSTVLRTLARVFSDLRSDKLSDFGYLLEFYSNRRGKEFKVLIRHSFGENKMPEFQMKVVDLEFPDKAIYEGKVVDKNYLPTNVAIYTTGAEEQWQNLLERDFVGQDLPKASDKILNDIETRELRELPGQLEILEEIDLAERDKPFLLVHSSRLSVMTLCGILAHLADDHPKDAENPFTRVLRSVDISDITGFSLKFRLHKSLSNFEVYMALRDIASRHIHLGADHLLVFDLRHRDIPEKILEIFGTSLDLFRALDRQMEISQSGEPTLQEVNIFFERNLTDVEEDVPVIRNLLFDWLSDGEKSFLGRMALLVMLDVDNSLIMLDEPEVHFNDYWKREIIDLLDHVMQDHSNHLLITTHSSIVLSDVTASHVILLAKDEQGIARRQFMRVPLLAVDPSEIMVNWFGTGRSVGSRVTRILNEAVEEADQAELERLLPLVGPGYWRYRIQDRLEELNAPSS